MHNNLIDCSVIIALLTQNIESGTMGISSLFSCLSAANEKHKKKPEVSDEALRHNIEDDYSKNSKVFAGSICFQAALRVAVADRLISMKDRKKIEAIMGNNYSSQHIGLMGIDADAGREFRLEDINQSGFIHFIDPFGCPFHTAYLKRADANSVFMYHTNCQELDYYMTKDDRDDFDIVGTLASYNLSSMSSNKLQAYLNEKNYSFVFTPARSLREKL